MVPFLKKGILPSIPVAEQTPTVRLLMTLVEQQQKVIDSQQCTIEQLLCWGMRTTPSRNC